jgi:hypothetical protein
VASIIDRYLGTPPEPGKGDEAPGGFCGACGTPVRKGRELCDSCLAPANGGTVVIPPRPQQKAQAVQAVQIQLGWLAVLRSPDLQQKGGLIALDQEIVVSRVRGSTHQKDVQGLPGRLVEIDDPFVSFAHLYVHRPAAPDGPFTAEPNPAAKNPVMLNDERLEPGERVPLNDGDVLRLGLTHLCFKRATAT